jgi:hypothetical protein
MNAPHFHAPRRTFSASRAVEVQGSVLTDIKNDDAATWKDIGEVLGKSEDRGAVYGAGTSPMDLPTFLRGCREWKGRFADPLLALVGGRWADAGAVCTGDEAHASLTLSQLLPAIIAAELDGETTVTEIEPQEVLIRRVHRITGMWLDMIAAEHARQPV